VAAGQANSNRQGLNKDALRGMQSALDDETAHADTFLCCRPLKDEHPLVVSGLRSVGLLRRQVTSGAWFSLFPPPALVCRVDYRTIRPVANEVRMHPGNHDIGL